MGEVMSYRDHPRLPHEDAPIGHCRWCGTEILGKNGSILLGRRLHDGDCRWNFRAAGYGMMRWAVFHRDKGVCAVCGGGDDPDNHFLGTRNMVEVGSGAMRGRGNEWDTGWEADHIYPLWLVDRSSFKAWRYWTLENLQTLCSVHHKEKSRREARIRAYINQSIPGLLPGRSVQLPLPEFPPDKMHL